MSSEERRPSGWARKEELIVYVKDSIQKVETGELTRLPTYQELADQFGYAGNASAYTLLKRQGIRLKDYMPPYKLPEPSTDLSWLLGAVSGGGSVNLVQGWTWLANTDEKILEKFRLLGERLFSLNAHRFSAGGEKSWGGVQPGYQFNSVKVARFLGDLREEFWARTILSQHPWVIDNSRYTWGFINGYFEKRGTIINKDGAGKVEHRIKLSTSSQTGANLIAEMLVGQGLRHPNVQYEFGPNEQDEQVRGVRIQNLEDIRLFAQHVHSVVPEVEVALEHYRTRFSQCGRYEHRPKYTDERLIEEWKKIRVKLDGNLTARRIRKHKEDGNTEISDMTYADRFGQGNFVRAREELEKILREERF